MMSLESFNLEGVDGTAKNWKEYGQWFSEKILNGTCDLSDETIIKVKITKDGKEYIGEGTAKTTVKSTLIELKDENLPFEKTTFASAIKKSLLDAVSKM